MQAHGFLKLIRWIGILVGTIGCLSPWLSVKKTTFCQLRLRQLSADQMIEWQDCTEHLCSDPDEVSGYSPCRNDVYQWQGDTYRRCECPDPSNTIGACNVLLKNPGTMGADYICFAGTCDKPCSKQPLDANFLPRCICP
ncbi:MAG: hypothetical protein JNK49_19070 [Planctomycetes bacterium]|nr:hypothetical protein [Planctomycetota bacterium]